ncbi:hypothetical protein GALMADRAFT_155533 [Galerina marginata CBS 339.88]|uniref:Uncharacterized protein n=1 Tax=Galerina marginata (strain CBS 339.88) TaxID=685588 RepID=A0A067TFJ9_GALM3|nr:hypothetical protein GALMADRAFT_155533 [Galerina marginata CBS 339.88]
MSSNPSTKFPDAQLARLKELIPDYVNTIKQCNPKLDKGSPALRKWREENVKMLMEEDLFKDLVKSSGLEPKKWEEAIIKWYTNYYNNKYLAAIRRELAKSSSATTATLSLSSSIPPENKAAIDNILQRAILTFMGDLSARDMFASENDEAIKDKMAELRVEHPHLEGGALRNKALKVLWDGADQKHWESKIAELAANVEENQRDFPGLMYCALQNLCKRDRLGSVLMSFSWAFRSPKDDGLMMGSTYTGYDSHRKTEITIKPVDYDAQLEAWLVHADATLPRKPQRFIYTFPFDEDGIPVLPNVDLGEASSNQVATLVSEYLATLWNFSHKGTEPVPSVPWDDIASHPDRYFDTLLHRLPVSLKSPDLMKGSPLTAFTLYEYFSKTIADSMPFQFYEQHAMAPHNDSCHAGTDTTDPPIEPSNASVCPSATPESSSATNGTASTGSPKDLPIPNVGNATEPPNASVSPSPTPESSPATNGTASTGPPNELSVPDVENATSPAPESSLPTSDATFAGKAQELATSTIGSTTFVASSTAPQVSDSATLKNPTTSRRTKAKPKPRASAKKRPSTDVTAPGNPTSVPTPSSGALPSSGRPTRSAKAGEKRKQPDTVGQETQETKTKKKKPGYFYVLVDADGNPIETPAQA